MQLDKKLAANLVENSEARLFLTSMAPKEVIAGTEGSLYVDQNQQWFNATGDQYDNNSINIASIRANGDLYKYYDLLKNNRDPSLDRYSWLLAQDNDTASLAVDLSPTQRVSLLKELASSEIKMDGTEVVK